MRYEYDRHKIKGMTLLEVMLVLAIAASMILLGLNMYQTASIEKDYLLLKANVDFLFQAMKSYYQTECDNYFFPNGSVSRKGKLTFNSNDASTPSDFAPVTFDVTTVNNYIATSWPRYTSVVALDTVSKIYLAQFNPTTNANNNAYVCSSYTTGSPQCSSPIPITDSSIVLWQSQIAVKMRDPAKTTYYVAMAGADCAVNTIPSGAPIDCSTGVAMGSSAQYMVWQRMPSFSSRNIRSSHWISNPATKEFKLQYTHDPMYELYNPSAAPMQNPNNSSAAPTEVYKYYYCGG